jgi:hypothetical protein
LREALEQAEGRDAVSERLRDFVSEIRFVPENGALRIMVKANTAAVLASGGLIISSRDGCGGPLPLPLEEDWVAA